MLSKRKIYVKGDSMVKHIKKQKQSNKLDQNCNVYVWNFPGAKVRIMEDYAKPKMLCQELNRSIEISRFPTLMKAVNITPVFEKDYQTDKANSRPIDTLQKFTKMFI